MQGGQAKVKQQTRDELLQAAATWLAKAERAAKRHQAAEVEHYRAKARELLDQLRQMPHAR